MVCGSLTVHVEVLIGAFPGQVRDRAQADTVDAIGPAHLRHSTGFHVDRERVGESGANAGNDLFRGEGIAGDDAARAHSVWLCVPELGKGVDSALLGVVVHGHARDLAKFVAENRGIGVVVDGGDGACDVADLDSAFKAASGAARDDDLRGGHGQA